jgi:uncharacterized protein (DUF488 family)
MSEAKKTIWTIGHSTRDIEEFLEILQSFSLTSLVDVRHYPGSKRYPHFNKDQLSDFLNSNSIHYYHIVELGGRRKPGPDSPNNAWKNDAFRGYADYMETDSFKKGISELKEIARKERTAYMCSEAVWWRCHRSLISDLLKSEGWQVMHILGKNKAEEHPYTSPAKIVDGKLSYQEGGLF